MRDTNFPPAVGAEPAQDAAAYVALLEGSLSWKNLWLTWAALRGELPLENDVVTFRRDVQLNGAQAAVRSVSHRSDATIFGLASTVEIVRDAILVDVTNTCETDFVSGIQRVVRETVSRWGKRHEILLVSWSLDGTFLRRLTPVEESRVRGFEPPADSHIAGAIVSVVPDGGRLIVPELAVETGRAARLLSLSRFSGIPTGYIGHDCVPLTSPETTVAGISTGFALYLDALGYADRIAGNSASTTAEFNGWKKMLAASGRVGPDVREVFLAGDSLDSPSADQLTSTAEALGIQADEFVVLVVGSHDPRKNHVSILQAARMLWEQGERFRLVFIGSGSWMTEAFDQMLRMLVGQARPIVSVTGISDEFLAASYKLADVSVFTSLHEGFGLPVVESLRAGTPVISSSVSSMAEIADRYAGVIRVDPHSDRELEERLRFVMHNESVLELARQQMAENNYRSWDDYASETWEYLTA